MSNGELSIGSLSSTPALVEGWLQDRKFDEIEKWFLKNFVQSGDFDFDFSDWDNEEELEEEIELAEEQTRFILMKNFGHRLSALDFEYILQRLDAEHPARWRPSEDRIDVEEVEEDEPLFETFSEAKRLIPGILARLDDLDELVNPAIGHNNPPEAFHLTASEISDLRNLLLTAQDLPDSASVSENPVLETLAEKSKKLGSKVIKYAAQKGDIFIDSFMKAASDRIGKSIPAAIFFAVVGQNLLSFGEAMIRLLTGG